VIGCALPFKRNEKAASANFINAAREKDDERYVETALNLFCQLEIYGYDFSYLTVWQVPTG